MMKKPPAPSELAEKFMLRLPEGMREEIKKAAEENNRSMNSEIVARLAASLKKKNSIHLDKQEFSHKENYFLTESFKKYLESFKPELSSLIEKTSHEQMKNLQESLKELKAALEETARRKD